MDANAEKLLRQLKQHRRSAVAYEKARLKAVERELRRLGPTDRAVQGELKTLGLDVKALLHHTAAEEKGLRSVHKKFLALERPPRLPGDLVFEIPPDPDVFDVRPPAIQGFGSGSFNDAECGFNLVLGEMNLLVSQ